MACPHLSEKARGGEWLFWLPVPSCPGLEWSNSAPSDPSPSDRQPGPAATRSRRAHVSQGQDGGLPERMLRAAPFSEHRDGRRGRCADFSEGRSSELAPFVAGTKQTEKIGNRVGGFRADCSKGLTSF